MSFHAVSSNNAFVNPAPKRVFLDREYLEGSTDLDYGQQCQFAMKLRDKVNLPSSPGGFSKNDARTLLRVLRSALESSGHKIVKFPLKGSQMADVVLGKTRPHKDTDFLILIEKPENGYALRELLIQEIRSLGFKNYTIPLRDNLMPFSIPSLNGMIDITIGWDLACTALTSADSFEKDVRPVLENEPDTVTFTCSDGYDPIYSLELLKKDLFYVIPGKAALLVNGLRGYVHKITSGLSPTDYTIEKEFIARWNQEFASPELKAKFLADLQIYLKKHYENEPQKAFAFCANLKCVFQSNHCDRGWLNELDQFIYGLFPHFEEQKTTIFWEHAKDRLDCSSDEYAPRYRVNFEGYSLLIEVPWEETIREIFENNNPLQRDLILARLASFPRFDHPIGKILVPLVKGTSEFVLEFSKQMLNHTPFGIHKFEELYRELHPRKNFPFGLTPCSFIAGAYNSGFQAAAARAVLELPPLPYPPYELHQVLSIASDWNRVAERAPHLLQGYIPLLVPSEEVFHRVRKLPPTPLLWPGSWINFVANHPHLYEEMLASPVFGIELLKVVRKKYLEHLSKKTPSPKLLDKLESMGPADEFVQWNEQWISYVFENPQDFERILKAPIFDPLFKKHLTEQYTIHVATLPPSKELLEQMQSIPVSEVVPNWSESWVEFIYKNPALRANFLATPVFGKAFHKHVSEQFIYQFIKDAPSEKLLDELASYPQCDFPIKWPNSWSVFLHKNPHLFERFFNAPIFGVPFRVQIAESYLKSNFPSNQSTDKQVELYTSILMNIFELDRATATLSTKRFFEKISAPILEKQSKETIESCWRLMQLCAGLRLKKPPLTQKAQIDCLLIAIRRVEEFPAKVASLMRDQTLCPKERLEIILELTAFCKVFRSNFKIKNEAIIPMLIDLLQEPELIKERASLLQLFEELSGTPLPSLLENPQRPFSACLLSIASDLRKNTEALKIYIHWLIEAQKTEPKAALVLKYLIDRVNKDSIDPQDAEILFEMHPTACTPIIVEIALSRNTSYQRLGPSVAAYLATVSAPLENASLFENCALAQENWRTGFRISAQIARLGGKPLIAEIQKKQKKNEKPSVEDYEPFFQAGSAPMEIWGAAKNLFNPENLSFQIALAKRCSQNQDLPPKYLLEHFSTCCKRVQDLDQIIELVASQFLSLEEVWGLSVLSISRSEKLRNLVFEQLAKSTNLQTNFMVLRGYALIAPNAENKQEYRQVFRENLERAASLPPGDFFSLFIGSIDYIDRFLSLDDWNMIFRVGTNTFEQGNIPDNLAYLGDMIQRVQLARVESHPLLLFFVNTFDLLGQKIPAEYEKSAFLVWKQLVLLAPKILSEKRYQEHIDPIARKYKIRFETVQDEDSAEYLASYESMITPIQSPEEKVDVICEAVIQNPFAITEQFAKLEGIRLEIEQLEQLFKLFQKQLFEGKTPPQTLVGAAYIIYYEIGRYYSGSKPESFDQSDSVFLSKFHEESVRIYEYFARLSESVRGGNELLLAEIKDDHLLEYGNRAFQRDRSRENVRKVHHLDSINHTNFISLMGKLGVIHSVILEWGVNMNVVQGSQTAALFKTFKDLRLLHPIAWKAIPSMVKIVMGTQAKEPISSSLQFLEQLTSLVGENGIFEKKLKNHKWTILVSIIHDMTTEDSPKHLHQPVVGFEFLQRALADPKWELEVEEPLIQLVTFFLLRDLAALKDHKRSLRCISLLKPAITNYYSMASSFQTHLSVEPEGFHYIKTPLKYLVQRRKEIMTDGTIEMIFAESKKMPELRKDAIALEKELQIVKDAAQEIAKKVLTSRRVHQINT